MVVRFLLVLLFVAVDAIAVLTTVAAIAEVAEVADVADATSALLGFWVGCARGQWQQCRSAHRRELLHQLRCHMEVVCFLGIRTHAMGSTHLCRHC
eukprot:6268903-Alexandrium_andersonii.AAC.1